jgi:hypothetical protein
MDLTCVLVKVDPSIKTAPTSAPSTVRDWVPVQRARIPPLPTMFLTASIGPSVVVDTRHLTDSKAVPPDKSEAMRRKAPRRSVLPNEMLEHGCTFRIESCSHSSGCCRKFSPG